MNWKNVLWRHWQGMSHAAVKLGRKLVRFFSLFPPQMFHCSVSLLPSCSANHPVTQPRLPLAWAILSSLFLLPLHPPHYCTSAPPPSSNRKIIVWPLHNWWWPREEGSTQAGEGDSSCPDLQEDIFSQGWSFSFHPNSHFLRKLMVEWMIATPSVVYA